MLTIIRSLASNPFQEATTLEHRLTRFLNDAFGGLDGQPEGTVAAWVPAVDVSEDANAIRIITEVPGVSPEDVKISHENNVLTIQGTKQQATFARSFTLPATVDANAIKANYQHGVLTVTLPKVEKARPRQIPVESPR